MSNTQKRKISMFAVKGIAAAFFCMGLLANCARTLAPTGGPRDTLPPVVLNMKPTDKMLNFDHKTIFIEFNEYVQLKDLAKEFYTSPGMNTKPTVTLRGRGIRIDIRDTLRENTTYAFNFGSAIADNNEGNVLHDFRYVFATGSELDTLVMSGYTVNALKGDSVSKAYIYFFDAALDSVPAYDSTVLNNLPEAIGRARGNGIFIAENLKAKNYRVYAVLDANNNQKYDAGTDMIGFLDSVYNPAEMPEFNVWFDTTRNYKVADPQLYFRMFTDATRKRQSLPPPTRPEQHKIMLVFGAPWPQIDSLTFSNIDGSRVIREYLKPTRDSMALWLDIPSEQLPDTIKGSITYMRHDSLNVLVPFTQELKLPWKAFESRQQERDREKLEKEIAKAVEEGREPPKLPNPFKYTLGGSGNVNPEKNIDISFDYPLSRIDTAAIALTQGTGGDSRTVAFTLTRDTMNLRKYTLAAAWNPGQEYLLTIPPGALTDVAGQMNDSITRKFEIMDPAKYARLNVAVEGKTAGSTYVLQLQDESGKELNEIRGAVTGSYTFNYVPPGKVRVSVIEDLNNNGVWDTGNLVERRQPERTEIYMHAPGNPLIETKADWNVDITIDMKVLFAPVTMQQLIEKLREQEVVRLQKLREDAEKRRKEQAKQRSKGGSATDVMRGSGLSIPGIR